MAEKEVLPQAVYDELLNIPDHKCGLYISEFVQALTDYHIPENMLNVLNSKWYRIRPKFLRSPPRPLRNDLITK